MMNVKLIGSAATLEALIDLILNRWGWLDVMVHEDGTVSGPKGMVEGLRVVKLRGRYRLEMLSDS